MKKRLPSFLASRLRLMSIHAELGYNPWQKPKEERKKPVKKSDGVYMGAREAIIPFLNDDGKRTFSHLFLRPGYMMRDYILRGDHERYLAPLTALLVFYSVFTLFLAVVKPDYNKNRTGDAIIEGLENTTVVIDSISVEKGSSRFFSAFLKSVSEAALLPSLDLHPEKVDTRWKASLAAFEGELRSKGVPLFLKNFLFLWLAMALLFRKKGPVSFSGAAAASAYIMCQFCIFMFLALLLSWGKAMSLDTALMGVLLLIDYRQMLGIKTRAAFWLAVKTGLYVLLLRVVFYIVLGGILAAIAYFKFR